MMRTVVLGAGPAGLRHARALLALDERCALTGVFDPDHEAAAALAGELDLPALGGLEDALAGAETAVVAGNLERRPQLARAALEAGLDVLVEPPLATAPDIAHGLLSAIVRAPRRPVAMVAHDEHFHPVVSALMDLLAGQTIVALDIERSNPAAPGPTAELDVVRELMIHDLQLVLALADQPISATQAAGRRLRSSGPIDHAQALLVLDDDTVVSLVASRAGAAHVRRVTVTTTQARIVADLESGIIEASRTTSVEAGRTDVVTQRTTLAHCDPTLAQAESFLRHVERRSPPKIGVGQAIAAQEAAHAILKRIQFVAQRPPVRRERDIAA
jgi:predicted dehydrogenase